MCASACAHSINATACPPLYTGEFHKYNNTSGLRNAEFYPLRTPTPCIAIRHMVPTDLAFMALDKYVNTQEHPPLLLLLLLSSSNTVSSNAVSSNTDVHRHTL